MYKRRFHTKDGIPYHIYYFSITRDGKRKLVSTGSKTLAGAQAFFKEYNPKKDTSLTLTTLQNEALNYSRNLGKEHHRQYKALWSNFIAFTGNVQLKSVSFYTVNNYINHRRKCTSKIGKPYSPCSINYEIAILKKSFEIAVENGWIEGNPAKRVKKLAITERVPELTLQEATALLNELQSLPDKRYYQASKIAFNTGLRRNEVASLKWEQVDLLNSEIHLSNKITKTPEFVTINEEVREVLSQVEKRIDGFVFNISPNYLYEVFKKAVKKLGLDQRLRFHSIRHTFITQAVNLLGIHIGRELARHSDIKQTERYYHSRKEEIKERAKGVRI